LAILTGIERLHDCLVEKFAMPAGAKDPKRPVAERSTDYAVDRRERALRIQYGALAYRVMNGDSEVKNRVHRLLVRKLWARCPEWWVRYPG